jgi:hypothetical protein
MSNKKKPKKLRTPNLAAAGIYTAAQGHGGGAEIGAVSRPGVAGEPQRPVFDYTYVRQDLRRILILASGLVGVIIALAFVLR